MRVGLLTTSFPRHAGDIAGQFVLGFAKALGQRGHAVHVLAPQPAAGPLPSPLPAGVSLHWVRYLWPRAAQRTFYGAGVPDNLARDPRAWLGLLPYPLALLRSARRELSGADALVSHWALPCALIAGAIRGRRPHVAVLHSADLHVLSRLPARSQLSTWIAHSATALVFVNERSRERFIGWLPRAERGAVYARSHVQAMGIDEPQLGHGARARAQLGLTRFTLLSLARLVPIKGLLEALSALAHRDDLEWLIAGEGPLESQLRKRAERTRLRVRLLGRVEGERKHALLTASDALLLPSRELASGRSEGAPIAALEAMAHGLPIVAANTGGIPELVRPFATGLLFDPRSAGDLECAVDRVRLDHALRERLIAEGQLFARAHYWSAIAPKLEGWLSGARATPTTSERGARLRAAGS